MERSFADRFVLFVSAGLGLGWSPVAPGTVGSVGGIALAGAIQSVAPGKAIYAAVVAALSLLGVVLSARAAKILGAEDPQSVVVDEIAAVLLLFVAAGWTWRTALVGFVLFRILDVVKPWPINAMERLGGGWGIMADDLTAGGIVAVALWWMFPYLERLGS